jgi:hypothetical protein
MANTQTKRIVLLLPQELAAAVERRAAAEWERPSAYVRRLLAREFELREADPDPRASP